MSRSYKRVPCVRDNERSRVPHRYKSKTIANRSVRRNENIPSHGGYRRIYDSWILCDYKFFKTEAQFFDEFKNGRFGSRFRQYNDKEIKGLWHKWYKSK